LSLCHPLWRAASAFFCSGGKAGEYLYRLFDSPSLVVEFGEDLGKVHVFRSIA
jgi:hypothetical protein